ncbi:MAG TPA: magnesium/cobalt transporter CorA [Thermoleophilaceae bacterium]|nr:magnesium/cobalt transporter CorA [Thermoleophilaceae bacterium]
MFVDCAVYDQGRRRAGEFQLHDALKECHGNDTFAWIGLYEPSEDEFDSVRREFQLHELAVEDAIKAHQRPKLEVYGDMLFLVLKTARYLDREEVVEFGEILVFLGHGFIITVRHGEATALHDVRENVERNPELLKCGPGAVLHAIVDRVVDDYMPAIEGLRVDTEEVETDVFSPDRTSSAQRIYFLKREVLEFTRATAPLVEPVNRLAQGRYEHVHPEVHPYFRDVDDHLARVHEQLEAFSDLLTSVLAANLSQVTVQQNEDVRKISAAVALIAVPTMIAGIYGMNFEHMPELGWQYGYPLVVGVMVALCAAMYRYFKRVGWL